MTFSDDNFSVIFTLAHNASIDGYQLKGSQAFGHEISSSHTSMAYQYHVYQPENYDQTTMAYLLILKSDAQCGAAHF